MPSKPARLAIFPKACVTVFGSSGDRSGWENTNLWCGNGQTVPLFQVAEGTVISPGNDMNHMALRLESGTYEEVQEYLEQNDCTVCGRPGDDRCIYFDDPDGHRLQALYPGGQG